MKTQLKNIIKFSLRKEIAYRKHKPLPILFDHLPKCAGTTINQYLLTHYPQRVVFGTNVRQPTESVKKFKSLPEDSRHRYHLIIGHCTHQLLDYVHPETIKLTVFRDPIERIISHYFFVKQYKRHYLHDQVIKSNIQLEDYASSGLSCELRNFYTAHFSGLPIEKIEMNPEESVYRAASVVSEKYNIVGFQDNLAAAMDKLKNVARLPQPFQNQVLNKTRKKIGLEEISKNARQTIAEVNALDVELYALLKAREENKV